MELFEEILLKNGCLKRIEKPKTTIVEIEGIINFKLPNDYKNYLLNYQAFEDQIGEEYFHLIDIDDIIETNRQCYIFDYLPYTIAIGGNGSSEFIAIEYVNPENYRIVLSPYIDLNKQYHIEIGMSFTDFLVRLENGHEWFEQKER